MANTEKQSTVTIDVNGKQHRFIIWAGMRLGQFIDLNGFQSKEVFLKATEAYGRMVASNPIHAIGKERVVFKDGKFETVQSVTYKTGLATRSQAEKFIEDTKAKSDKQMTRLFNALNEFDAPTPAKQSAPTSEERAEIEKRTRSAVMTEIALAAVRPSA